MCKRVHLHNYPVAVPYSDEIVRKKGGKVKKIKRTMQQVCHSERSVAKSKNLRTYSYICSEIGAKILRFPSVAQDDTVLSEGLLMKDDDN